MDDSKREVKDDHNGFSLSLQGLEDCVRNRFECLALDTLTFDTLLIQIDLLVFWI